MSKNWFNTIGKRGPELVQSESKALGQKEQILEFFKANPHLELTPFGVNYHVFNDKVPITSVRRALSVLTKDGKLVKTNKMVIANYGEPNHLWKLA